jgi:hypothetical protein
MRTTKVSVTLAFLMFVAAVWLAASPKSAHACSVGSFGSPERQIEKLLELIQGSDAVFVGTVLDEQRVGKLAENEVYVSKVRPEAVISGDIEGDSIAVQALAFDDTFCNGGPRLREGEKVLLALDWQSTGGVLEGENGDTWTLHSILGKVRIDGAEAVSQYADLGLPIGSPEDVIRQVGGALHASPDRIEAAVTASAAPVVATDGGSFPLQAFVAVTATIFGAAVFLVRRSRQSSREI